MAIFTFENVTFKYPISGRRKTPPIDGVSFTVRQGEFVLLCGATGSGKSTLMKLMKPQLTPKGTLSGSVKYFGRDFSEFDGERTAFEIGFVSQDPETQIVTDTVRHELAFGLENRGVDSDTIRRKVGETASFFGLESIFNSKTELLSGGQKQLLCLASVMVTEPKVLILDEPTSQLDPIAASEFLSTVFRLNRELGLTVIISEHRTEDIFPNADKIIMLEDGKILCDGSPREVAEKTEAFGNEGIFSSLPTALKIGSKLSQKGKLPLTVKEGRDFLTENYEAATVPPSAEKKRGVEAVTAEDVYFRYEKHGTDILSNMSFTACEGEFLCILGGNGAGKSTAIKVLTGLLKPYSGTVKIGGKNISKTSADVLYRRNIALLPQDPKTVLTEDSVELSLRSVCSALGLSEDETREAMGKISEKMNLSSFMDRHPYDLSGGERQRAALAAVLLSEPKILFLDEPTKGIDSHSKIKLGQIFNELKNEGVTVIAVSHDVEFAAEYCDRCALFFDGGLISSGTVREFFSGNSFYTTAANRMARHLFPGLVTWREVVEECRKQN